MTAYRIHDAAIDAVQCSLMYTRQISAEDISACCRMVANYLGMDPANEAILKAVLDAADRALPL